MSDYTLGTARGVIRLEFEDAGTGPAEQAIDNLGSTGERTGQKVINALSGAAAVVTGTAVAVAGAVTTSVVKTGVAYNTLEQTSRAAFKTILGSGEAAEKMMSDIAEFGKTSPFPRQAFIEATQQMLGFGFAAEDVIPTLEVINDATAALGGNSETIAQFTSIFSKIKSNAKITGEEVARLGDLGVDAIGMLSEAAGVTGEEMRKSISDGAIDADTAIQWLTEGMRAKFEGASANVKETWAGAVDRMKGAWRDLSSALVNPLVDKEGGGALVGIANGIADALRAVIPSAERFAEYVGPAVQGAADRISAALSSIDAASFEKFLKDGAAFADEYAGVLSFAAAGTVALGAASLSSLPIIGPLFAALSGPVGLAIAAFAGMFAESETLREAFSELIAAGGRIAKAFEPVGKAFMDAFGSILEEGGDAIGELALAILPSLETILTALVPALEIFAQILDMLSPIIGPLIETALLPLVQALEAATPIIELLGEGLQWIADQMKTWSGDGKQSIEEFVDSFDLLNTDALDGFQGIVDWIRDNWPQITETFDSVVEGAKIGWQSLVDFFTPVVETLIAGWQTFSEFWSTVWDGAQAAVEIFMEYWSSTVQPGIDLVTQMIVDQWTLFLTVAGLIWAGIRTAIQNVMDWWNQNIAPPIAAVVGIVVGIMNTLKTNVTNAWNGIRNSVAPVVNWFMTYVAPLISAVMNLISAIHNSVLNTVRSVWNGIQSAVLEKVNAVKNGISLGWAFLGALVNTIFNQVLGGASGPLGQLLATVSRIVGQVIGVFAGAGSWLFGAGQQIIGGLIAGVESMLGSLTAKLNAITSMIPKEKGPPEKDKVLLTPAGQSIMTGLIAGIMSQVPALQAALGTITTGIPDFAVNTAGTSRIVNEIVSQGRFSDESSGSVSGETNQYNFGDLTISLADLAQLKDLEEFFDMLRAEVRKRKDR